VLIMNNKILSVFMLFILGFVGFAIALPGNGLNEPMPYGTGGENMASQNQEMIQTRVQEGTHMGEGGQMFQVQTQANNQVRLEAGGIEAKCFGCNLTQEMVGEMTKLSVQMSNGKNAEVKVMPDTASETALERLRLKTCSEENNCSIELKEVGKNEEMKLAYELKTERNSRVFGMFKTKMNVRAQVDAETGELLKVKKPWWAFLASEPAEE
jgi:hypothetical protein